MSSVTTNSLPAASLYSLQLFHEDISSLVSSSRRTVSPVSGSVNVLGSINSYPALVRLFSLAEDTT